MEYYYETLKDNETISLYVTKKSEIMVEASDDGCISRNTLIEAVCAKGFNCCFDTRSKREFAESCNFENIKIRRYEIDDEGNFSEECVEYSLNDLKNVKILEDFLGKVA